MLRCPLHLQMGPTYLLPLQQVFNTFVSKYCYISLEEHISVYCWVITHRLKSPSPAFSSSY
ncbi:hypothetical protein CW304_12380 [Bacillus sp. UFRGS-B20]|nr:hypothetical protein CW304_12380 [Bacillus sp. UFRGS-B20]